MNQDRVQRTLARANTGPLPRGELFIYDDFLNHFFGEHQGDYGAQLDAAARALGLSLVGVDLNSERGASLLHGKARSNLEPYFTVGCINGPVSRVVERLGFLDAMVSMKRSPSLFSHIARELIVDVERKAGQAAGRGFRAMAIADDIAGSHGLFFSPRYFSEHLLPVYRELAVVVRAQGLSPFFHSDGDVESIIEPLIEAGYACLHPIDTQGGINIYEADERFGGRICYMGHVDILAWNEEAIRREIRRAEEVFETGGLIVGSTCGISMSTVTSRLSALYPSFPVSC